MSGTTTELGLSTAVDSDDNADYLTINLANSLRTVDALFNNVTGHNHSGAHQGGAVAPATGSITGGMIADGTITATDIADASITNAKLGPDVARENLLTNGGFELWQRGTAFSTNNIYTADRWVMSIAGGDAYSVSRDSANADTGSQFCALISINGSAGSNLAQALKIVEFGMQGRTMSFSARVKASAANQVRLGLGSDGTGGTTNFSAYHTGGGVYQTLTVTYTVPANATSLVPSILPTTTSIQSIYIDNACLVVGSQPANYVPLHPADDLARCQRYYETIPTISVLGYAAALGQQIGHDVKLVQKAVVPTVTKYSWADTNCSSATDRTQVNSLRITATPSGSGAFEASGGLQLESNP